MSNTTWTSGSGNGDWFGNGNWSNFSAPTDSSTNLQTVVISGAAGQGPTISPTSQYVAGSNYANNVIFVSQALPGGSPTNYQDYQLDDQSIQLSNNATLTMQGVALGRPGGTGNLAGPGSTISGTAATSATPAFDTLMSITALGSNTAMFNDVNHNFGFLGANGVGNTLNVMVSVGGNAQAAHALFNFGEINASNRGVVGIDLLAPTVNGDSVGFYNQGWVLANQGTFIAASVEDVVAAAPGGPGGPPGGGPAPAGGTSPLGYVEISNAGEAILGTVAAGQDILFNGGVNNTLALSDAPNFAGTVVGFVSGQTIDIQGFSGPANVSTTVVNGVTELLAKNGGTTNTITLGGSIAPFFNVSTISQGGTTTEVISATAADYTFTGAGTTTSWFNPNNWAGGVSPGSLVNAGETVTIPTGTAAITGTAVTDNGLINVTGSTTALNAATSIAGNGTVFIDNGGHFTLSNTAGNDASLTVDFGTHGTSLAPNMFDVNNNQTGFGGTIGGFGINDQIVLGNSTEPTPTSANNVSLNYNSTTNELTVSSTVGASISTETLHLTGTFDTTPGNTLADSVGANGITIAMPGQTTGFTFTGAGTTTSWFNPNNWAGGVSPGSLVNAGETVTIPTGTAAITGTAVTDNGLINVTGSTTALNAATSIAGNGTVFIDNGGHFTLSNTAGNDASLTVDFGTHGTSLAPNMFDVNNNQTGFGGTIGGFGINDQIVLGNSTEPTPTSANNVSLNYNSTTGELVVSDTVGGSIVTESLHLTGTFDTTPANTLHDSVGANGISVYVACFAEGTRILTSRGEIAVEALAVGDQVVTARKDGPATRPITWIGQRSIALDCHPQRSKVEPVRIQAGAFGDNQPARDLVVSPDHAIFVGNRLIEAKYLVNGASIRRDTSARRVHYYHIELDQHDVLIAEGLAAESYINDGNRGMFTNGGEPVVLHPDFAAAPMALRCAPLLNEGAEIEAIRAALRDRVMASGFTITDALDASLVVGGRVLAPLASEPGLLRFALPDQATGATLHVATATPADTATSPDDRRQIGLKLLSALVIDGVHSEILNADRFDGLFDADQGEGRWSTDELKIDLSGTSGSNRVLELRYNATVTRWVAPVTNWRAVA